MINPHSMVYNLIHQVGWFSVLFTYIMWLLLMYFVEPFRSLLLTIICPVLIYFGMRYIIEKTADYHYWEKELC